MKRKRLLFLAIIAVLVAFNALVFAGQRDNYTSSDKTVSGSDIKTGTADGLQGLVEEISWTGWQKATIAEVDVRLYADEALSQPLDIVAAHGETVVVCKRRNDLCRIRYGSIIGWTTVDNLSLSGDPIVYNESGNTGMPENLNGTEIADRLDSVAKQNDCIGVQAAVISNGEVRWLYEYGYGNRGDKIPMSSDTKIRVASLSKVVTAMGIMSMQDMSLLDIDEDISSYWNSDIRNPNYPDCPITFRDILTHTSSLTDFGYKKSKTSALEEKLKQTGSYMNAKPGSEEAYKYNNSAICTAGAVAGKAADCNFDQYIREYFFGPLDIDASFYAGNITRTELVSPTYNDGITTMTVQDLLDINYYGGVGDDYSLYAGGLIISAQDFARMMCILLGNGSYDNMFYMTEQSVDQILDTYYSLEDYDQCLVLRYKENMLNGEDMYYHNGNLLGVYSFVCFNRETGNGMVIITNGANTPKLKDGVYSVCGELAAVASELW